MNVFYRSVPLIPFHQIDGRLTHRGIIVECDGPVTALIGAHGTVFVRSDGYGAQFERPLGANISDVFKAIESEYGVSIVDDDDLRFWEEHEYDERVVGEDPASPSWILIENAPIVLVAQWMQSVHEADNLLEKYYKKNPVYDEVGVHIDIVELFEFGSAARMIMCALINRKEPLAVNLAYTVHIEAIVVMIVTGFLTKVGQHYRLSIPASCDVADIMNGIVQFIDAYEGELLQIPKLLVSKLTQSEMQAAKYRLMLSDRVQSEVGKCLRLVWVSGHGVHFSD